MTQKPKGTKDITPKESYIWKNIKNVIEKETELFNYKEIITPMFEYTELFKRSAGETTDVVQKEMYSFTDKAGKEITLKPEGTAGVVRAFIENKLYTDGCIQKLYYITPCFRYENTQQGRQRQFTQFGVEVFNSKEPSMDVEVISLASNIMKKLDLKDVELRINNIGCPDCREEYNKALKEYFKDKVSNLCNDCKDRYERNPLRIIDCKVCGDKLGEVPSITEYTCDSCNDYYSEFKEYLEISKIKFIEDTTIVRGLDYYTQIAFEFKKDGLTVCGGGRYNKLTEELGGPDTPAVGFGMGLERIILLLNDDSDIKADKSSLELFIIVGDKTANKMATRLVNKLREAGISCDKDFTGKRMKSQLKYADKLGVNYVVFIGEQEIENGTYSIKDMSTGVQEEVIDVVDYIKTKKSLL